MHPVASSVAAPSRWVVNDRALRLGLFGLATIGLLLFAIAAFMKPTVVVEDARAYFDAATRLLDSGSPYRAEELAGAIAPITKGAYLYPPPLAQVLTPLSLLPLPLVTGLWLVLIVVCALAAAWLAAARLVGRDRALFAAFMAAAFWPALDTIWEGQVSSLLALATALALSTPQARRGALAIGTVTLMKLTSALALPAAWLALPGQRRLGVLLALVGLLGMSLYLSPLAWSQWPTVLINQLAGGPAGSSLDMGFGPTGRGISLCLAGALFLASLATARRRPAFALAAGLVAGLLVPAVLWYHYLVILLPFLVPLLLSKRTRWTAIAALLLVDGGLFMPALLVGGVALTLVGLWQTSGATTRVEVVSERSTPVPA